MFTRDVASAKCLSKRSIASLVAVGTVVSASAFGLATSAQAQTVSKTFDVICTQGNVNSGAPFVVPTTVDVVLPDNITPNQELFPEVNISVELPAAVTDTIHQYGYDTMEGAVDVTASVADPAGTNTSLTASGFPLPSTPVPATSAPFTIATAASFPSYTTTTAGDYTITLQGPAITITDVVVSEEATGDTYALADFGCEVDGTVTIGVVNVAEPAPADTPTTPPAKNDPAVSPAKSNPGLSLPVVSG